MVAHRMSTLRQCDKIVFMSDEGGPTMSAEGCGAAGGAYASEEGTHEELIALVSSPNGNHVEIVCTAFLVRQNLQ